jgi:hypothetical protein
MKIFELPPAEPVKLINADLQHGFRFKMLYVGVGVAILGVVGFFLAFFYQNWINTTGISYRWVQGISVFVVFLGWLLFTVFASSLGISTRKLTYNRLVAILKNQVEVPMDIDGALRRQVGLALSTMQDDWGLYPAVFVADPEKMLTGVIVGPGGVFPFAIVYEDPHSKKFLDPMQRLVAGSKELEKQLKHPVKPLMIFLRNRKNYHNDHEMVRNYTTAEVLVHLKARDAELTGVDLTNMHNAVRLLANLP